MYKRKELTSVAAQEKQNNKSTYLCKGLRMKKKKNNNLPVEFKQASCGEGEMILPERKTVINLFNQKAIHLFTATW